MLKWILLFGMLGIGLWIVSAYNSSYTPISKQIDLKTMSLKKPDYIIEKSSDCVWTCKNYTSNYSSSSSFWWWGSLGGK